MTPGEQAAMEQHEHDGRLPICAVGQARYHPDRDAWDVVGWRFDYSPSHPRAEAVGLGPLPDAHGQPLSEEVWGTGWTGVDLVEIAVLERCYEEPDYEAGQ